MNKYDIIYHHHNEETAEHEWKLNIGGVIGFLVLDDLEVRGQNRINDHFFSKYENYIEYEK